LQKINVIEGVRIKSVKFIVVNLILFISNIRVFPVYPSLEIQTSSGFITQQAKPLNPDSAIK
jgi:hypothetical protein